MRKLLWFKVGKIADKKWYMRKWFGLLNKVPEKEIFRYYHNMIHNANKKKTRMVRICAQHQTVNMAIIVIGMNVARIRCLRERSFKKLKIMTVI